MAIGRYDQICRLQTAEGQITKLFRGDEFRVYSQGWGLFEHEWSRVEDYRTYVLGWLGTDHKGARDDATISREFAVKFRLESAKFGARLYDVLRVASADLTEAECAHCQSPVYNADTDTVFSKLHRLETIQEEGDPDLVWKNEFSMKCGSCGAPGTKIHLDPMVGPLGASLGRSNLSYFWPFQKDDSIGVDIGLEDFINRAVLAPFREGIGRSAQRIKDKFTNSEF